MVLYKICAKPISARFMVQCSLLPDLRSEAAFCRRDIVLCDTSAAAHNVPISFLTHIFDCEMVVMERDDHLFGLVVWLGVALRRIAKTIRKCPKRRLRFFRKRLLVA